MNARTETTATDETVARTILAQLGGMSKLVVMLSAKDFVSDVDSLTFKWVAKSKNKANCLTIKLAADDTYTLTFHSLRGLNFRVVSEHEGVYADSLRSSFTHETGLYLSL